MNATVRLTLSLFLAGLPLAAIAEGGKVWEQNLANKQELARVLMAPHTMSGPTHMNHTAAQHNRWQTRSQTGVPSAERATPDQIHQRPSHLDDHSAADHKRIMMNVE